MSSTLRDGSTSTFSLTGAGSADRFPILTPFVNGASYQAGTAVISAAHINKYFDACIQMQSKLKDRIGYNIVSPNPSSTNPVSGTNLLVAYDSHTVAMTGDSISFNMTIPAMFGTYPFTNTTFSIGHTLNFRYGELLPDLQGVWAYVQDTKQTGVVNTLMTFPQFYVTVVPVTGRVFTVNILNIPWTTKSTTFSNTTSVISDSWVRSHYPYYLSYDYGWFLNLAGGGTPFIIDTYNPNTGGTPIPFLSIQSLNNSVDNYGLTSINGLNNEDQVVTIDTAVVASAGRGGLYGIYTNSNTVIESGYITNRSGIALRTYTNGNLCSFYGLSMGDYRSDGTVDNRLPSRVVKLNGFDITAKGTGQELTWPGSTGTFTDLTPAGSVLLCSASIKSIRFSVTGVTPAVINLEYKDNSDVWHNYTGFPLVDNTPLATDPSGRNRGLGLFMKEMTSSGTAVKGSNCL